MTENTPREKRSSEGEMDTEGEGEANQTATECKSRIYDQNLFKTLR